MKKGSLSLSVNAIVIFVLAFAMLGFGLFIINMLQSQIGEKVDGIFDVDSWNPPPNSQNPIAFKGTLIFKKGANREKTIGMGFYNSGTEKDVIPATSADCGTVLNANGEKILFSSLKQTVGQSSWKPFEVTVTVEDNVDPGTYICNIKFYEANSAGAPDTGNELASRQVSIVVEG